MELARLAAGFSVEPRELDAYHLVAVWLGEREEVAESIRRHEDREDTFPLRPGRAEEPLALREDVDAGRRQISGGREPREPRAEDENNGQVAASSRRMLARIRSRAAPRSSSSR